MTSVVISSGHGLHVRGASGILDEVDEARAVVEQTAADLRALGVKVTTYHDDISTTQQENLQRIVDFHNAQGRDLDVSVHFNSFRDSDDQPMQIAAIGTEVWYLTQAALANQVASAIAMYSGLIDRGGKPSDGLYFLNNTAMPAVLLEICFVDSVVDAETYRAQFDEICEAIADTIKGWGEPVEVAVVG